MARSTPSTLEEARDLFLERWGAMGPAWGVSRTLSQIHALLMVASQPLTTDDVMAELGISRGSAHGNLQELVGWGLARRVKQKGDRKDYYEGEKDVWRVVQAIARERRRKEVDPVLRTLDDCLDRTKGLKGAEAEAFRRQIGELRRFAGLGDQVLGKVERLRSGSLLTWIGRFLK